MLQCILKFHYICYYFLLILSMLLNYIHPSHYFNNQQIGVKCPIPLKLRQLNRISIELFIFLSFLLLSTSLVSLVTSSVLTVKDIFFMYLIVQEEEIFQTIPVQHEHDSVKEGNNHVKFT